MAHRSFTVTKDQARSRFDQEMDRRRAGDKAGRVGELVEVFREAAAGAESPEELSEIAEEFNSEMRREIAPDKPEDKEKPPVNEPIEKATGPRDRGELEQTMRRVAKARYPDVSEEAALGKLATTEDGKRLREIEKQLPEPKPEPETFEKSSTATEALLDREAKKVMKEENVGYEMALSRVQKDPTLRDLRKAY